MNNVSKMKTQPRKILLKAVVFFFAGLIALWVGVELYGRVSSHIPRTLQCKSSNVVVKGVYYFLPISGVSGINVGKGSIVITGYNVGFFPSFTMTDVSIVRALPNWIGDMGSVNSDWVQTENRYGESLMEHTFAQEGTKAQFTVMLPRGNSPLNVKIYDWNTGKYLFVVGAGEWKVGPPSYYC